MKKGKLELSLEPERLGKLTIRLEYEKGKTEVTIFSTSAKTLEILSKEAGHLAQILEEKTGTPTVIYTRNRLKTGKTWIRIPVMAETAGRIKRAAPEAG
ncbi:MAG: flagellar hook-length control protein FliK [Pilosibacter sp.]